jgi:transcription initiation factor TFIID TATA-box-binding protein
MHNPRSVIPAKPYAPTTSNIVARVRTGTACNIAAVAEAVCGRVAARKFPAAICSLRAPTATANVFSNGNLQWVGCMHTMDILLGLYALLHRLSLHLGTRFHFYHFSVCNVVCSASLGHFLDLDAIHAAFGARSVYNKELFEGLQLSLVRDVTRNRSTITLILFTSGRFLITGGQSQEEHNEQFVKILPILRQYRLDAPTSSSGENPAAAASTSLVRQRYPDRFWFPGDSAMTGEFRRVPRGIGGCWHTEEKWTTGAHPSCAECGSVATSYQFELRVTECEHDTSWSECHPVLHTPFCDTCGETDTTGELMSAFIQRECKRDSRKRRRDRRARTRSTAHPSHRCKRYKPAVLLGHNGQGQGSLPLAEQIDARGAAEERLEHTLHDSNNAVQNGRVPNNRRLMDIYTAKSAY